jgi:hypothetical protein
VAKPSKTKPKPGDTPGKPARPPADPELARVRRRRALKLVGVGSLLIAIAVGFWFVRGFVERRFVFPTHPPLVELVDRPAWMSDFLADQIIAMVQPASPHSALDHQLLQDRVALLESSPWVRRVNQVRRVFRGGPGDVLLIDCQWRTPAALVQWRDEYWLVDAEGVKLPERFSFEQLPALVRSPEGRANLRIIEGVLREPVKPGARWGGDDLAAGLELAAALANQPWADEIERVNVSNFGGRITPSDAQLTLITRYNTELRFGRPISAKDFYVEIPWQQKLQRLEQIYRRYGRVDAGAAFVELRFDRVEVPADPGSASLSPP